jgi:hypothetical protein
MFFSNRAFKVLSSSSRRFADKFCLLLFDGRFIVFAIPLLHFLSRLGLPFRRFNAELLAALRAQSLPACKPIRALRTAISLRGAG